MLSSKNTSSPRREVEGDCAGLFKLLIVKANAPDVFVRVSVPDAPPTD